MKTIGSNFLFSLVESFFVDYLRRQRGASVHTVRAYRDALKLLFEFVAKRRRREVSSLNLSDFDADAVAEFLDHVENGRKNSATTRNCRRAAIRCFFKHLIRNDLEHSQQYMRVLAIPAKRARERSVAYLEPRDVRAVIAIPDRRTADGQRDYALLLFLYNSGARVSEAIDVRWEDVHLSAFRQVQLRGKGKKDRTVPLWKETADALFRLRKSVEGHDRQHIFLNRAGLPLTRCGVAYIIDKHVSAAAERGNPRLARKKVTPHVLRHSCAVALLQSGTDLVVIRDYLGHSSVSTTGRYLKTNLQMKRDALNTFWKHSGIGSAKGDRWKPTPNLLAFLHSL